MDVEILRLAGMSEVKMEEDEDLDVMDKSGEDDEVDVSQMLSVVNAAGNIVQANHATLQSLLSTPAIPGSHVFAQSEGIQVITLPTATELMGLSGDVTERLVHVVPAGHDLTGLGTKYIGLIAISNSSLLSQGKGEISGFSGLEMVQTSEAAEISSAAADSVAAILMPPPPPPPDLPPNCPPWAMRLKKCEKIGDSYRGYVENEIDLDLILTLHKQQTNSFWGTRQSPSPAKTSTRLMWKSQYVPFDGIPFVNAGSRAVVMECQYGPRRKGTLGKRGTTSNTSNEFKQTCPARIYIKKVRKFPSYAVNLNMDKKSVRLAMDKAFHELREQGLESWGEERYYVQLPTEKAHDYHEESSLLKTEPPAAVLEDASTLDQRHHHQHQLSTQDHRACEARIHPAVLEKIRQLVASGETKLYTIRRQLRRFVVRDMFQGSGQVPERHDLTMFPTVNDLKNHIHQALKDIESGILPYSAPMVSLEVIHGSDGSSSEEKEESRDVKPDLSSMWSSGNVPTSEPMPETVTVTLTQNPGEDGHHIISRIETHLSDGTTQVSTTLTPETAQLLSRLHPGLFPAGSILQLEGAHGSHVQSSSNKSLTNHIEVLEVSHDTSPIENPVSSLESSMEETVHVIGEIDSSHLPGIVDMDSAHNISEMIDSDTAASMHSISSIHLDPGTSQHISGLLDSDSTGLGAMVTQDAQHHITGLIIPSSSLSMLSAMDPAALSEIVSAAAAIHPVTLVAGDPGSGMDLVTADGVSLVSDKKNPDQNIRMTRLENKVSDL